MKRHAILDKGVTRHLIAGIAIVTLSTLAMPASAQEDGGGDPMRSISVNGIGTMKVVPDQASITLGVKTQARTTDEALSQNNEKMEKVFAGLMAAGIEKKDIQTSQFSIWPEQRPQRDVKPGDVAVDPILGYSVSNKVDIVIRDLDAIGDIIDTSVRLGVNASGGISFGYSDPEELEVQARQLAVQDAIDKAKTLAEAAGVSVGKVMSISEFGGGIPRPPMMMMDRAMTAESVPVSGGEQSFSVSVDMSFRID